MIHKLIRFLNQPFPLHHVMNHRLKILLALVAFGILFMLYFEPFKYLELPVYNKTWVIIGYGIVGFTTYSFDVFIIPSIIPKYFKEGNWKVYMHMLGFLWSLTFMTAAILCYNYILGLSDLNMIGFFQTLLNVVGIVTLPAIISTVLLYNYELKVNLLEAKKLQDALETQKHAHRISTPDKNKILLADEYGKEVLQLIPDDIILVKSADNYVEVYWKSNEKVERTMLRQTMKSVQEQLEKYKHFFRCHRSYIINLLSLRKVSGNSLGCKLILEGYNEEIPVARNNKQELHEVLTSTSLPVL